MPISSLSGRDPDPEDEVDDLDDHERGDDGVGDRRPDRDELGDELLAIALDQARVGGLDGGGGEDAGGDGAEHAADAVDGEDVERVVDLEPRAQERRAVAQAADDEADDQRAAGVDEAGRRRDRDEAGDGAAGGTDDADLALVQVAREDPRDRRRGGGRVRDDEGARGEAVRRRPPSPALKPNQPNHRRPGAEDGHRDVVRLHAARR